MFFSLFVEGDMMFGFFVKFHDFFFLPLKFLVLITQLLVISFGLVLALLKLEVFLFDLLFEGLILFVQVLKLLIGKLEFSFFCSKFPRLELFGFKLCLLGLDFFKLSLECLDE
jgi:hypothetical protein